MAAFEFLSDLGVLAWDDGEFTGPTEVLVEVQRAVASFEGMALVPCGPEVLAGRDTQAGAWVAALMAHLELGVAFVTEGDPGLPPGEALPDVVY